MVRPGIVDLRDLNSRYAWNALAIPRFVERAGLAPAGEVIQRFAPPRVVVAIVPVDQPELLERSRGWLAGADRVVLALDGAVADFDDAVWGALLETLPNAELVPWMNAKEHVARALELAANLPAPGPPAPAPELPQLDLPPSSWMAYTCGSHYAPVGIIASQLVARAGRALLLLGGTLRNTDGVDLAALPPELMVGEVFGPDRTREARRLHPGFQALGFDPVHPVGWRGDRMMFYWFHGPAAESCFLSANDHDWPCGPAKKLLGHMDNDPVQIALAPDISACLWRFEHDVTLTSAVPIRWQRAGAVDVATFPPDPQRAVWFEHDERFTDLLDDDVRAAAPAMVLGPDAATRYALDLSQRVFRIMGKDAQHVGGPDAGFVVCSSDHRIVRRASGRLVGGWFRWATVLDAGLYWREDLATGARTPIAADDRAVCEDPELEAIARDAMREGRHADAAKIRDAHPSRTVDGDITVLAIPGTRNVLLVAEHDLRVI